MLYSKSSYSKQNFYQNLSSIMFGLVFLVAGSIATFSSENPSPGTLLKFENMNSAIEKITDNIILGETSSDYVALVNGKLVGISEVALEYPDTKSKRWNAKTAPLGASWTEHQTAQQGTWLAPWYPASCVHQNEHGDTPISVTLTQAMSYGRSAGAGFNFGYGHSSSLSINFETTENNSQTEARTYTVPAHSYGQVWQQQLMVWQDQQHRKCKKHHYQKGGIKCGPWSEYIRGDLPVKNGVSFGWSTGKENMNFHSCGGGT